ncbi:MAG: flagellin [Phycisphaerales bacterium]|nr:flagellin [Phycisphaerales bacterium]
MARINTNVGALVAQRHLASANQNLNSTIQRLSSGLRITRGADDPAGLIVSERLRAEISAVGQAISNTQRASLIIATTEGALDEVARLLVDVQDLIVEAANDGALSEEEIRANQLQVDSAIESITRIANSTTFAGRQLLNGSLDYITSGTDYSVIDALNIHSASFGTRPFVPVTVEVTTSAQPAILDYPAGNVTSSVVLELQGNLGVATLQFTSGTAASAMVAAINAVAEATGVTATLSSNGASGFRIESQLLGSRQFVSVRTLSTGGSFQTVDVNGNPQTRDIGRDAVATVNGASSLGDGNHLSIKTGTLDMEIALDQTFGLGTTSFAITSGGANFQVGPEVNTNLQVGVGVQSVAATRLGDNNVGFLTQIQSGGQYSLVAKETHQAQRIVREAIRQVAVMRGRLGAFEKNTLDTNVNQLGITLENLMASESQIRDADFAQETSTLARDQILVQAGTSVLALAQQTPQSVLQLLG